MFYLVLSNVLGSLLQISVMELESGIYLLNFQRLIVDVLVIDYTIFN